MRNMTIKPSTHWGFLSLFFCLSLSRYVTPYPLLQGRMGVFLPQCVLCQSDKEKLPSTCMSMNECARGAEERMSVPVSVLQCSD